LIDSLRLRQGTHAEFSLQQYGAALILFAHGPVIAGGSAKANEIPMHVLSDLVCLEVTPGVGDGLLSIPLGLVDLD
jgi:hypothetical protein